MLLMKFEGHEDIVSSVAFPLTVPRLSQGVMTKPLSKKEDSEDD